MMTVTESVRCEERQRTDGRKFCKGLVIGLLVRPSPDGINKCSDSAKTATS